MGRNTYNNYEINATNYVRLPTEEIYPTKNELKVFTNCDSSYKQCRYLCCPEKSLCILCHQDNEKGVTNTSCSRVTSDKEQYRRSSSTVSVTMRALKMFINNLFTWKQT